MKKQTTVLLLVLFLMVAMLMPTQIAFADSKAISNLDYANKLKIIGVFQGTGSGFELDRAPTRLEGLVMLIRLLGKSAEANDQSFPDSGFNDVPEWGKKIVNYAKAVGLTNGMGDGTFGSDLKLSCQDYSTFLLRALDLSAQSTWQTAEQDIVRLTEVTANDIDNSQDNSANTGTSNNTNSLINGVIDLVNAERQKQGLAPYKQPSSEIQAYADLRANELTTQFSHLRPNGENSLKGVKNVSAVGENVAAGQTSAEQVVNEWMNSPDHRSNILSDKFTHMAIGYKDNYWVQIFYTPFEE